MNGSGRKSLSQRMGNLRGIGAIPIVLAGLLLLTLIVQTSHQLTGQNSTSSTLHGPPFAYSYTCCAAPPVKTTYHPGETIVMHWIRTTGTPTRQSAVRITLWAGVSGPYRTVLSLKTDSVAAHPHLGRTTVSAVPIRILDTKLASPISTLQIPTNAGSGYYNVSWKSSTKDLSIGGAGIIRIASPTK